MFELVENIPQSAVIKVIGVGGGGGNAVHHMISNQVEGVEFICANTDAQALDNLKAKTILQMGSNITKGLGAGANPDVADKLHWKIEMKLLRFCLERTWFSSLQAWVEELEQGPHQLLQKLLGKWEYSRWQS